MANKKKKKKSNSYWMKYGGPTYKMGHGGNTSSITNDPTFKMWFTKNARRPDVMQSTSDPVALKQIFLKDINFPGNEMPTFSNEIDAYGNVDKSDRSFDLSEKMIGGLTEMGHGGGLYANMNKRKKAGTSRSKANSTISPEAYKNMQDGFKKYGGASWSGEKPVGYKGLPKAEYGTSTEFRRDYSGVHDRHHNFGTTYAEGIGESNVLQNLNFIVPGLGFAADFAFDLWGHQANKKRDKKLTGDKFNALSDLDVISREGANKGTLDLTTRKRALGALGSYVPGSQAPQEGDLTGDIFQNVVGLGTSYAKGQMKMPDWMKRGTAGAGIPDSKGVGDVVDYDDLLGTYEGDVLTKYGGSPNKAMMGGLMGMSKTGLTMGPGGINQQGGAMDMFNPMAHQFKYSGLTNQGYEDGGMPIESDMYEAEGGEVIMHEPDNQPQTTGELTSIEGNDMLSELEGASHDEGGEMVSAEGEQYVFSETLKSEQWGGISFADAAEKIAKNISKFEEEFKKGDDITKSTAESMIQAWQGKLEQLRQEQEQARQAKFEQMVAGGASQEQLMQNFPDLYRELMARESQQGQEQEEPMMEENPMGAIDMSELSGEEQQMVEAKYGLPKYVTGGDDPTTDFNPYSFNTYLDETGLFGDDMSMDFDLNRKYMPNKRELKDYLSLNFPDEGYTLGDQTFTNVDDFYKGLMDDYSTKRSDFLTDKIGVGTKPHGDDYKKTVQVMNPKTGEMEDSWDWKDKDSKSNMIKDKAAWKLYNSGLPFNWEENYGEEAGISNRKYFNSLRLQLEADGMDPDLINSIIDREKMKKAKLDEELSLKNDETVPPEDKAEKFARNKELMGKLGDFGQQLLTMAPTIFNFKKGTEAPEYEEFYTNPNDQEVRDLLTRMNNVDIDHILTRNEQTFNNLKYLARDASDGSGATMMNTLIKGMNFKNNADRDAFIAKWKQEGQNNQAAVNYLSQVGERDRAEGVRQADVNAQNRAAVHDFLKAGFEGLSNSVQTKQLINNMMKRDETLKGLLNDIYPDVQKYMNQDGGIDFEALRKNLSEEELQQIEGIMMEYFKGKGFSIEAPESNDNNNDE